MNRDLMRVVAIGGIHGSKPIKPSGEILTRAEFIELVAIVSSFYEGVSDKEIEAYNHDVMYETYRDLGKSHEEAIAGLEVK